MKRLIIAILAMGLFLAAPAAAAPKEQSPKKMAAARELAQAMGYAKQMEKNAAGITGMLVNGSKNFRLGLSEAEKASFSAALSAALIESLSGEFLEGLSKWLAEELSAGEITELKALFSTPGGRKLAKIMPSLNLYVEAYSRALIAGRYNSPDTSRAIFGQALGKLTPKLKDKINRLRKEASK